MFSIAEVQTEDINKLGLSWATSGFSCQFCILSSWVKLSVKLLQPNFLGVYLPPLVDFAIFDWKMVSEGGKNCM